MSGAIIPANVFFLLGIVAESIVRIKYPYSTFGRVLHVLYIVVAVLFVLFIVWVIIMCNAAIDDCLYQCNNCNIPGGA